MLNSLCVPSNNEGRGSHKRQWKKLKHAIKELLRPFYTRHINQVLARQVTYTPYLPDEKIRIIFLFQIPSFWPSWDTVLEALRKNPEVDIRVILFDNPVREIEQIKGAEAFLRQIDVEYVNYNDFDLKAFQPHIIVYQTPYDRQHRPRYLHAHWMRNRGYRVVYIPYGIEITKTARSVQEHFQNTVVKSAWRVYTFSDAMREDYLSYLAPGVVRVLGHPKFDKLYKGASSICNNELISRANGRRIVLWKIHFPFSIFDGGKEVLVTPDINEYAAFSEMLDQFSDLFFFVMPHPKFMEMSKKSLRPDIENAAERILSNVMSSDNAYLFEDHDYRPALACADCFIMDRSAVMIEAGVTGKPIFYMSSKELFEPLSYAVEAIVLSYYQGNKADHIFRFIEMFRKGLDPKRAERLEMVRKGIPFLDGNSGNRIALDMIEGVKGEKGPKDIGFISF